VSRLELKIPPDVVWVLVAGLMWLASLVTPHLDYPTPLRVGATVVLTVTGVWAIVSARVSLERANTAWGPMSPERTTSLVTSGVYGFSRNPMYLGMLLLLIGWAVLLATPAALAMAVVFVLYLDRFQIGPEERVLTRVLGQEYLDYMARVRRWL